MYSIYVQCICIVSGVHLREGKGGPSPEELLPPLGTSFYNLIMK